MNAFPYSDWVDRICRQKHIEINGEITQIKANKLICIPSDIGNLYLKMTGTFIVDELEFTLNLLHFGLISKPELIAYDSRLKIALTRDMGGDDLSALPILDIETAHNVLSSLADMQLASIKYVKSKEITGIDYRIDTMLRELDSLPDMVYKMLSGTKHAFAKSDLEKLTNTIKHIASVLESFNGLLLPDTLHHGDLGAYNVRITGSECIFYDWGCGGVSHPFFDTCRLLSHISKKLPADISAEEALIEAYLIKWTEYGSCHELKDIFAKVNALKTFYMLYVKYIRARNLHIAALFGDDVLSGALEGRYESVSEYMKRLIIA